MRPSYFCAAILLCAVALLHGSPALARDWYVSGGNGVGTAPAGRDGNSGTLKSPFLHIQAAASRAQPGDTVFVRGGNYFETVIPARSGLPGHPIVYRPYGREFPVIHGGVFLKPSTWKNEGSGQFSAPWPGPYHSGTNQSDQVFYDARMIHLARWPHEKNNNMSRPYQAAIDSVQATEKTGKQAPGPRYDFWRTTFTCNDFAEPSSRWVGAKVWINCGHANDEQDGNGITGKVIAADGATHQITIEVAASGKVGADRPANFQIGKGSRFYLFDPVSADGLQNQGEWWHDPVADRLLIKTPDGGSPARHQVEVKQRDLAFDLDNRSYITVRGFYFFGASITTDHSAGNGQGNGGNRLGSVAPSHHLILDSLRGRYVSHFTDQSGDFQTQWSQSSGVVVSGSDCIIRNCDIVYSAGCGIVAIGERNRVLNNLVHDVGYNATDGGGIALGVRPETVSRDVEVAYNTLYNVGIDGIEFGALKNSDPNVPGRARLHHNLVHDCVLQSADSGGLHTFASDGQWVRVDHNVVYSIGGPENTGYQYFGIYLDYAPDEGKTPARYIVDHNVVYNTPSPLNLNHANTVQILNNTLISATLVARSSISSNGGTYEGVVLKNNLGNTVYRGDLDEPSIRAGKNRATYESNVITVTDTLFVNATHPNLRRRDHRLRPDMAKTLIDKGVDVSPYNDATPPDIGAYEAGKPKWPAGVVR